MLRNLFYVLLATLVFFIAMALFPFIAVGYILLLGYAGWGEGQLEEELNENVWLTADADSELIFDADYQTKWARALAGLGVDAARLSAQSGRA